MYLYVVVFWCCIFCIGSFRVVCCCCFFFLSIFVVFAVSCGPVSAFVFCICMSVRAHLRIEKSGPPRERQRRHPDRSVQNAKATSTPRNPVDLSFPSRSWPGQAMHTGGQSPLSLKYKTEYAVTPPSGRRVNPRPLQLGVPGGLGRLKKKFAQKVVPRTF